MEIDLYILFQLLKNFYTYFKIYFYIQNMFLYPTQVQENSTFIFFFPTMLHSLASYWFSISQLESFHSHEVNIYQLKITSDLFSCCWSVKILKIVVKYTYHKAYHFSYFYARSWVTSSAFTLLYNHHCHLPPELSHLPELKRSLLNTDSPYFLPQPLLSAPIHLPIDYTSCKQNHSVFVLCLVPFI